MPYSADNTRSVAADPMQSAAMLGEARQFFRPGTGSRVLYQQPGRHCSRGFQLGVAATVAILISLGALAYPATADSYLIPLDAIGRVLDSDYEFKCTGFIIASVSHRPAVTSSRFSGEARGWYENMLITAGHCLDHTHFFLAKNGQTHTIQKIVAYSDHQSGYDVLVAKFTTSAAMPTLEPAYGHTLSPGDPLMLVGYGRTVLQIKVNPFVGYNNRGDLIVDGISGPGDSGSPILLPGTRMVVGILHTGTVDVPQEGRSNPYFCMFESCPSTHPYFATPIDRIQGMARW